jgi:AcrR family transcriptional regulator
MIETAAALLADHEQVTLRRLAAETGTSTMAIYTNFGGMPGVWRAVRQEGFTRLASRLRDIRRTNDPVYDAMQAGVAYIQNALDNPALYRVMFEARQDLEDPAQAAATFEVMVDAARRCVDEARFDANIDPSAAATQLWAAGHGFIMLVLSGALRPEELLRNLPPIAVSALAGFGDRRGASEDAVARAFEVLRLPAKVPTGG